MMRAACVLALCAAVMSPALSGQAGSGASSSPAEQASAVSEAQVEAAIDKLTSFDLPVRTDASRTLRRAPAAMAVPALTRAARQHRDGYVRYRAQVLLAGFGDATAAAVMRELMSDANDRLRMVAYGWYEHHRDAAVVPALVDALAKESSEFVRPALLRALAAAGDDPRVRAAVMPLIMRGQDDFRGALIAALGDYRASYARDVIADVARLEGPLQDDAVVAIGKIGGEPVRALLSDLQRNGPRSVQPSVAAAMCLIGNNVTAYQDYLVMSLRFAAANDGYQPLVRSTAQALADLAVRGDARALNALLDAGTPAKDPVRAPIALAVGLVALRNSAFLLEVLGPRADRQAVLTLLQDAFDMLSAEDYELERFYVDVRHAYWDAAPGSPRRQLAEALIQKLEF